MKFARKMALLILAAMLCGCSSRLNTTEPKEYEYTSQEVLYSEENEQFSFRKDMDFIETSFAKYYFDPSIENNVRNDCIEATDKVLSTQTPVDELPEIYVLGADSYSSIKIIGHKLFQSVRDWQSVDYATDVLLATYGRFSHYGLAYGYAFLLSNTGNVKKAEFALPDIAEACDLNLLCFNLSFISEGDIAKVRAIACDFVNSYIAENGERALQTLLLHSGTADGMQSVSRELSLYYRQNGVEYIPSVLRYGYGGVSYDYVVSSDLATFYLETGWSDINLPYNPLVYEGFLHKHYADVKQFYETNLAQMEQYQILFDLDNYDNDLSIVFSNSNNLSRYSFYQSGVHRLYVKNIDSLMHEYIHALTQPQSSMEAWETEGFARFFSYRYDDYGIAFLNQDYNNAPDSAATQYVHEFRNTINRPINMSIDYKELENIAVWSRSYTDPNASYVAGSSFVQYLVSLYGEKAVIDAIYGSKEPLPKSYEELVRSWNEYIENTYQGFSKYK